MVRLTAFISLAGLLILVGALVSIPLMLRDPVPVARPEAPISLTRAGAAAPLSATLLVDRTGRFNIVLDPPADSGAAASAPRLSLEMPHREMAPIAAEVRRLADGRFLGSGALHMPGRWTLTVEIDDERHVFDFVLAEF